MQLQSPSAGPDSTMQMHVDGVAQSFMPAPVLKQEVEVLKRIKKLECQILCPQHNPTIAAQKKASKQEKIKNDLLALPTMSRIKIRVASGVFEVTLMRVIEETGSVEVLWDRGLNREFKWGCVVFGSTEGPVLQKPSTEGQTPAEYGQGNAPASIVPKEAAAASPPPAAANPAPAAPVPAAHPSTSSCYPYGTVVNTGWTYTPQQLPYNYGQGGYGWSYPAYYQTPAAAYPTSAPSYPQTYQPGTGPYAPTVNANRDGRLQWQSPYEGPSSNPHVNPFNSISPPPPNTTFSQPYVGGPASATVNGAPNEGGGITALPSQAQVNVASPSSVSPPASTQSSHTLSSEGSSFRQPDVIIGGVAPQKQPYQAQHVTIASSPVTSGPDNPQSRAAAAAPVAMSAPLSQFPDLSALMKLPQNELDELLNKDPQLSRYVMAAIHSRSPVSSEGFSQPYTQASGMVDVPR